MCQESHDCSEKVYCPWAHLSRKTISWAKLGFEFQDPTQKKLFFFVLSLQHRCIIQRMNCIRTLSKVNHKNPFSSSFLPKQWPFVRTLPTPEPIRQRVARWGRRLILCVCQSAVALFAYYCTSIWSSWLLWLCPGVPWKRHWKPWPSAHFYGPQNAAPLLRHSVPTRIGHYCTITQTLRPDLTQLGNEQGWVGATFKWNQLLNTNYMFFFVIK